MEKHRNLIRLAASGFAIALGGMVTVSMAYAQDGSGMGAGMMGGGMMGQPIGQAETKPATIDPKRVDEMQAYIQDHQLACMQCHSMTGRSFGPSFDLVSARYANQPNASALLANHIANGIGNMPAGLASPPESEHLAKMILDLSKTAN